MTFRPFLKAREYVWTLKLKNRTECCGYCKSGNKPEDIPASVHEVYKKEFKGWGDWLGSGNISRLNKVKKIFGHTISAILYHVAIPFILYE